jgi:hypothetical protein
MRELDTIPVPLFEELSDEGQPGKLKPPTPKQSKGYI